MKRRYEAIIKKLNRICRVKGFAMRRIGETDGREKLPLFAVIVNGRKRKTAVICAGVHGNEGSGPEAVLTFLRGLPKRTISLLPRIVIFPVVNPSGYDRDTYRNANRINLNRHFGRERSPQAENAAIMRALGKTDVDLSVSLHEDDVQKCCYLYAYGTKGRTTAFCSKALATAGRCIPVCTDKRIYRRSAECGMILNAPDDGSFESWISRKGARISICFEVPDAFPQYARVRTNVAFMNEALRGLKRFA